MKKYIISVPYSIQLTEDKYKIAYKSKVFNGENNLSDMLAFVKEINPNADLSICILSELIETI